MEFAPQTPLEQRAWNACSSPGVWRWHIGEVQESPGKYKGKRWATGLIASEAFERCPPADEDEREALLALFAAIEAGAITGSGDDFATTGAEEEEGDT